jgi:hypothetical protein
MEPKKINFMLQVNDKTAQKFVVICPVAKQSKRIYDLASGNHEMYMRRKGQKESEQKRLFLIC